MKWFAEWRLKRLCKEAEKCCVKYGKLKVVNRLSQALGTCDLHTHTLDDFKHEDACHDPLNHTHDHSHDVHVHDDNCLEDLHLHDHHHENHVHSATNEKSHHMRSERTSNGTYISELDDPRK